MRSFRILLTFKKNRVRKANAVQLACHDSRTLEAAAKHVLQVILSWIIDSALISDAISGRAIINEQDVETQPEKVPAYILYENF